MAASDWWSGTAGVLVGTVLATVIPWWREWKRRRVERRGEIDSMFVELRLADLALGRLRAKDIVAAPLYRLPITMFERSVPKGCLTVRTEDPATVVELGVDRVGWNSVSRPMASSLSTISFSEIAADLQKVASWLARLGIDERPTRLGEYRRVMQELADAHAGGDSIRLRALWPSSMVPLFESQELVDIHRWLGGKEHDDYVRDRMRIVATGPSSYTDEDTSSGNRARNTAFELAVAARIVGAGWSLDRSVASDVAVRIGTRTLAVECKRPQSEDSLARNADDARRQLRKRYAAATRPGCVGLIAVDVTKIHSPGYELLRGVGREEISEFLGGYLEAYSREHDAVWQKNRDEKTAAVLLRLNLMAQFAGDSGLTSCQQVVVSFLPFVGAVTRHAIEAIGDGFVRF